MSGKNIIKSGELVLIYLDSRRQYLVQLKEGLNLSTDLGNIKLGEVIGNPFGYEGKTHLGRPFCCLKPSISDLMFKVRRKTTIVYPKDFGYLLLETAIGPGARVVEIGTGSGALTLALAHFVAPDGMVYTYERRPEFIENARANVERVGLSENVQFFCQDVAEEGISQKEIDAIYIDVPEPWAVIGKASFALKGGYHLVSWSPNIEQVKKTVEELKDNNFTRIRISEITERELLVRLQGVRPKERGITHTAYLIRASLKMRTGQLVF